MKWYLLEQKKCPKCEKGLAREGVGWACRNIKCGFFITSEKMAELTSAIDRDSWKKEMEGYGF